MEYKPKSGDIWCQHEKDCKSKNISEEQRGYYLDNKLCGCKEIIYHIFDGNKWIIDTSLGKGIASETIDNPIVI